MHRLNQLASKLTPAHLREVEDFAEFLITRQKATEADTPQEYVDVDAIAGMFEGLGGDRINKDLIRDA